MNHDQQVKDIVLEHPETALVFQQHRIDYCCRGGMTVREALASRVDPAQAEADVWRALEDAVAARRAPAEDVRALSTPALIARIVDTHHAYLRRALPFLTALTAKVARVHGDHNPKLPELARAFAALRAALEPHLDEEERVLFPAILAGDRPDVVARELEQMHAEHREVGEMLAALRALADDFVPPPWACTSYRTMAHELEDLEGDTLRHVHLENHVLAPRLRAPKTIAAFLEEDHAQLDALLDRAVASPDAFDADAFEMFRARLMRHMAIEERIVYPDARARRGDEPLAQARHLRVHHAALALLATQPPSRHLVGELRQLLLLHMGDEEGPGGAIAQHALLLSDEDQAALVARALAFPEPKRAEHLHPPTDIDTAVEALRRAQHAVDAER